MQYLLKPCQECHQPMNGGVYRSAHVCPHCGFRHDGGKKAKRATMKPVPTSAALNTPILEAREPAVRKATVNTRTVTANETASSAELAEVKFVKALSSDDQLVADLGMLKAEGKALIKITPDMIENGKFVGANHKTVKSAYTRAKKEALTQLRLQAAVTGANTVSEVKVKHSMKTRDSQNATIIVRASGMALVLEVSENAESA